MASRRTALLLPPTLDEVKDAAARIQLPEREAVRFWNFYESKGWMVGRNKMVSFLGALTNWKLTWEDRGCPGGPGVKKNLTPEQTAQEIQDRTNKIIERIFEDRKGKGNL